MTDAAATNSMDTEPAASRTSPRPSRKAAKKVEEKVKEEVKAENGDDPPEAATPSGRPKRSPRVKRKSGEEKAESAATPSADSTRPKRRKVQTTMFQSPNVDKDDKSDEKSEKSEKAKEMEKNFMFKKSKFLAVRNSEGGFYLCQTTQNVYRNGRAFKVRWLDETSQHDVYELDFYDNIELETVLTVLKMVPVTKGKRYRLPEREKERVTAILKRALDAERRGVKPEAMQPMDPNEDEEDEEVDEWVPEEEEEEEETKPARKTPAKRAAPRATARSGRKGKADSSSSVSPPPPKSRGRPPKQTPTKAEPKAKSVSPPRGKRHPNDKLIANPDIKVIDKDPFFETSEDCPHVSASVSSKLIIRAVLLNDNRLLQRLVDDKEHIAVVNYPRCIIEPRTALQYALQRENTKAMEILVNFTNRPDKEKEKRIGLPSSFLDTVGTGRYNHRSLNIRTIRKLTMSRGSREGTNALTKDNHWSSQVHEGSCDQLLTSIKLGLEAGVKFSTVQRAMQLDKSLKTDQHSLYDQTYVAVRHGHHKLAGQLIEANLKSENLGHGFNSLHKEVLLNDKQELGVMRMPSVKKKPYDNCGITPIHCAAINPNPKYLTKLLSVLPDYNIMDSNRWRPIHYAAACEGTGPLEYLLGRGISVDEVESGGMTPLMIACINGRSHNVELLLKKATDEDHKQQESMSGRWGVGGINRSARNGKCPVHMAAEKGHLETIKVLVKYGADLRKQQSAGMEKRTALHEAAAHGHLHTVKFLVKSGAVVEQLDRFKRTALTLACMNGQAHVTSYLLSLGANPNHCDSSGNSCLHYAVAYGWYHCMQYLLMAGADPTKSNDWKVSLLHIAFMKGHLGLMDALLEKPGVDINFRDDNGATLVMLATGNSLSDSGFHDQMTYLVVKHGADCTLVDSDGNNALHHLTSNVPETAAELETIKQTAELLKDKGCDFQAANKEGLTPVMTALRAGNTGLVEYFVLQGARVTLECDSSGKNALHWMAAESLAASMDTLLQLLAKEGNDVVAMAKMADDEGFTPLLTACHVYSSFNEEGKEAAVKLKRGFAFIKTLLEVAKPDLATTVAMRRVKKEVRESLSDEMDQSTDEESEEEGSGDDGLFNTEPVTDRPSVKINGKKNDPYSPYGKYSAVHFLVLDENHMIDDQGLEHQDYEALRTLLSYKPPLDLVDKNGLTPLLLAIKYSQVECAEILVEAGADVNIASEDLETDGKSTPLIFAAKGDHTFTKLVGKLIQHGADVSAQDQRNLNTALHYAASMRIPQDLLGTVRLLVDGKADVNALNNRKRTPLHLAVNANTGTTDESTDIEEFLLANGADVFAKDVRGRLPVHYAFVKIGRHKDTAAIDPIELVSTLTSAMKSIDINHQDEFGQTCLHRAALRGATVCCMHLLQKGSSINVKDNLSNTALALAVVSSHCSCFISLLQKNANINVNCIVENDSGSKSSKHNSKKQPQKPEWVWKAVQKPAKQERVEYPLFQAILSQEWQGVTYMYLDLIDKFNVPYAQCVEGALAVHKFRFALRLITRQAELGKLTQLNASKQTLFHVLCQLDGSIEPAMQMKVAEALQTRGVPLNEQDVHGCTPLHYAALSMNVPLMNFILEKGPGPFLVEDEYGRTPLGAVFWDITRSSMVDEKIIRLLLKEGDLNFLCDYPSGAPGHHSGGKSRRQEYTSQLNEDSSSPLVYAVSVRNLELSRLLITLGADVNMPDSRKRTPLMHAVRQNDLDMVKLLLDHSYTTIVPTPKRKLSREDSIKDTAKRRVFQLRKMQSYITFNSVQEKDDDSEQEEEEEEEEEGEEEFNTPEDDDSSKPASLKKKPSIVRTMTNDLKMDVEFSKKSGVDLTRLDDKLWTVLHHLALPTDLGTFDNTAMLKILADAGAPLETKNSDGDTALDLALKNGGENLAKGIQKLLAKPQAEWSSPLPARCTVEDGIAWDSDPPNYSQDADSLQKRLDEVTMETEKKQECLPDEKSELQQNGEIVVDAEQNIPYDVFLSKVDVNAGPWGMYNFYKLQLIREKGKDLYIVFTRWGRMGDDGQFQKTPYPKLEEGVKEFCKIFKEKTANEWAKVQSFEKHPKKYYLNEREDKRVKYRNVELCMESSQPTKLPVPLADLFKAITDVATLEVVLTDSGIDKDYLPVGGLNRQAIMKAKEVLSEISATFEKTSAHEDGTDRMSPEQYQAACEKIAIKSNEFYQLVPRKNFVYERIEPLNQEYNILANKQMLANLLDWEIAAKIITGAQYRIKEINPLDYVYRATGCEIKLVDQNDVMTQYILQNIHNTKHGSGRVEAIFSVSRPGEEDRLLATKTGNRRLLWHGTGSSNVLGILSRGLVRKPLESNHCGSMFGEGIYFADSFCKSSGYSYNCSGKEKRFILLTEVALGKVKEYYSAGDVVLGKEYNSVKGIGRRAPDPGYDIHLPSGAVLSLGAMRNAPVHGGYCMLEMNEYIVYSEDQACLRYMVQFTE